MHVVFNRIHSRVRVQTSIDAHRTSLQSDTGHPPFWMYLGAGRRLFELAKSRVFDTIDLDEAGSEDAINNKKSGRQKWGAGGGGRDVTYRGKRLCVKLEGNPKWDLLRDVLAEIEETRTQVSMAAGISQGGGERGKLGPTLVIVRDERTASQVCRRIVVFSVFLSHVYSVHVVGRHTVHFEVLHTEVLYTCMQIEHQMMRRFEICTNIQARDVMTYGTHACTQHAFRRYCYKRLDSLRQVCPHIQVFNEKYTVTCIR